MSTCFDCGAEMRRTRESYKYDESGLPGITLRGIMVGRCPRCHEVDVHIPNIEGLHRAIALALTRKTARLAPQEIRFLRKYLRLSGTDFAQHLGVAAETVSRWEQGKSPMGTTADRLVRMLALTREPISDYPLEMLKDVAQTDPKPLRLDLTQDEGGWHPSRELAHAS